MLAYRHEPLHYLNDRKLSLFRSVATMDLTLQFNVLRTMVAGVLAVAKESQFKILTRNMVDLIARE